jgi:hypothetical protein
MKGRKKMFVKRGEGEILLKRYRRINGHLRAHGINIISIDSDGNIEVLLPMPIEAGFNHILPVEQAASMDAVKS